MPIGGVVQIKNLRFRGMEDLEKIRGQSLAAGIADLGTGMSKLEDGGITPQAGRLFLLLPSNFYDFRAGKLGGGAGAGSPGTIRGDDPGEAEIFLSPAGADAREGHDFQVVGMGPDAEVSGGGQGGEPVAAGGSMSVGLGLGEFQRWCLRRGWRLGEKTQREAAR